MASGRPLRNGRARKPIRRRLLSDSRMYRRHGQKLGLVFLACDLAVTAATWLAAYYLRYALWPAEHGVPDLALVLRALPLVLVLAGVAYRTCGLYEIHRLREVPRELSVVCQASGLLFV